MVDKMGESANMTLKLDEQRLNKLIANHLRAIRFYVSFAVGLVTLGVVVFVWASFAQGSAQDNTIENLIRLGGGFISSLSALQIKEIITRKERAEMCGVLKTQLIEIQTTLEPEDAEEIKRIRDQIDEALKRIW